MKPHFGILFSEELRELIGEKPRSSKEHYLHGAVRFEYRTQMKEDGWPELLVYPAMCDGAGRVTLSCVIQTGKDTIFPHEGLLWAEEVQRLAWLQHRVNYKTLSYRWTVSEYLRGREYIREQGGWLL